VTTYEHVMLGVDGALAAGLHRRWGWPIVAWSGFAAALPDWDGLTFFFGGHCYAAGHRVWGHNLLVAGLTSLVIGAIVCRWDLLTRVVRAAAGRLADPSQWDLRNPVPCSARALLTCCLVGVLAAYSHLATDLLFSYGTNLPVWEVPLLWPFSGRSWAYPMVRWGDPGPTIIFAAGMLAMARWKSATRSIALGTLALIAAYVAFCGLAA
jgi:membrane-bound metal-dependent hydrolase YbcI (DUF457 family)